MKQLPVLSDCPTYGTHSFALYDTGPHLCSDVSGVCFSGAVDLRNVELDGGSLQIGSLMRGGNCEVGGYMCRPIVT